jgi:ubiquinone/menaquinone biosynthesis C-methylase UbiE
MAEQVWDSFARLNAAERFKAQSAEMGSAVTEAIVVAARISAGLRVLDVACGSGEPSISMAVRLKDTGGRVTGMDMAGAPLEVADGRAQARGLDNVEFVQGDVHAMPFADGSFDRVTCRLGVMFFSDLAKALGEMHRVLKPGGSVALLTWGPIAQPYFESTIGTVRRMRPELEVPETARAMFKFGEAGTLSRALKEAGFDAVREQLQRLRWDWHGTPEEMWEYFRGVTVPFRGLLENVEGDAAVEQAVLAALRERFDGEWVRFEAQMVVATAVRD